MLEATFAFRPGARVRVRSGPAETHCRTPFYLRGKAGVVEAVAGAYRNPARLAFHKPGLPLLPLYRVRFRQKDVWPDYAGPAGDTVVADVYENWLLPQEE